MVAHTHNLLVAKHYNASKLQIDCPPHSKGRQASGGDGFRAPKLASPQVATRNGLASLPLECAILTHRFCHRAGNAIPEFDPSLAINTTGRILAWPAKGGLKTRAPIA